jgi:hypothetical protein
MTGYCETTSSMGRLTGVLPETVRAYCDLALVDHVRLANGTRLLKASAAKQIKAIYAERMARRGRARKAA